MITEPLTKDNLIALIDKGLLIEVGSHSYGVPIIKKWDNLTKLKIGDYCSIADNVVIFLGGEHRMDWISTYSFTTFYEEAKEFAGFKGTKGDIIIGNDVWIGSGVTIMSGVTIGDGAVIGAKTVVAKDVKPYSIIVGNPAKEIKKRFTDEQIEKLLQIKWWDWEDSKIKQNMKYICNTNVQKLWEISKK